MADTTTTNLGLVKPEVGASTDAWGPKLNGNLDDIDALFDAGPVLKLAKGGTGASTAAGARTALGLGALATLSAVSAAQITDGGVGTAELADDSVTAAKIATNAVGTTEIADDAITAAKIAANAVGTTKIADSAVTAAKIADGTVGTSELADGSVTASKIADGTITSAKIADGTIVSGDLASNSVTTAKITDVNVTTAKIADAAVTPAKLSGGQSGSAPVYGARAWVNFNGGTAAINASGNVASVVRNGTGEYTITFTTAMPNANYVVAGSARRFGADTRGTAFEIDPDTVPTTTVVKVRTIKVDSAPAPVDATSVHVVIFG